MPPFNLRLVSLFTLSLCVTFIQMEISRAEQILKRGSFAQEGQNTSDSPNWHTGASPFDTGYQPLRRLEKHYHRSLSSEPQLLKTGLQLPALSFQRNSNDRQREEEGSYYYAVRAHGRYRLKTRSSQEKSRRKKSRRRPGKGKEGMSSSKSSSSSGKGKGKGEASDKFQSKSKPSKGSSKKQQQKSQSSKSSSKKSKSKSSKMAAKQPSLPPVAVPTLSPSMVLLGPTVSPRVRETTAPAASLEPQIEAPTRSPNTDPTTETPTLSPNTDQQTVSPTLSPASDPQPTVSPIEIPQTQTMSPMMNPGMTSPTAPPASAETRAPVAQGDANRFAVLFDIPIGGATEADLDAAGVVTLEYLEDYFTTQFEFNRLTNMEAFLGVVVGTNPVGALADLEIDVVFSDDSQFTPSTEDITSLLFVAFQEPFVSGLITRLQTELPASNPVSATTQVCNSIWLSQCPFR